jgi:hypothetical protein
MVCSRFNVQLVIMNLIRRMAEQENLKDRRLVGLVSPSKRGRDDDGEIGFDGNHRDDGSFVRDSEIPLELDAAEISIDSE